MVAAQVPPRSPAVRVLINAMSGAGARIGTMSIGFLLTPYVIAELGLAQYGLWSVIGTLSQYLGLLDFGVGGSFVKFITEYVERDDRASARQVVMFGMVFYTAFGLVLALPVFVFAPQLIHLFKMPAQEYAMGAQLLRVIFAMIIVFMIVNVPGMVVVSMHRMDLASRNGFLCYVAYAIVTLVFLKLHYGIAAVILGQAAQLVTISVLQIRTASRLFGSLWHNPLKIERAIVNRLFGFGGWSQMTSILSAVNQDVSRFVGAGSVGVASVAAYEIANRPASTARMFPAYLLDALMPSLVVADTRGDDAAVARMYATGTRYNVFVALLFAGLVIGGADPLIVVWLGHPFASVSAIMFWLALGSAISALASVGMTLMRAAGTPKWETAYMAVSAGVTVVSVIALAPMFGIVGVAAGTAIGWFVSSVGFVIVYHRKDPLVWWRGIGSPAVRMAIAASLATYAFYAAVHVPVVRAIFVHRLAGFALLALLAGAYVLLFVLACTVLGVWSHDREALASRFRELRARLGR